jgi:hypothetical protein
MNGSFLKPKQRIARIKESGFVSFWFATVTLGVLVVGFTFLTYSAATLTKMQANFMTMNLVTTGALNSEFDDKVALNNMQALARIYGYSTAVNTEEVQIASDDSSTLYYASEARPGPTYGIRAYIYLNNSPLLSLLGYSSVQTAAYARSEHSPTYINLSFDYSHSLAGGSIDELLQAFEITDGSGGQGVNGEIVNVDGVNTIVPRPEIQTLLPYSLDPVTGIVLPWSEKSTLWPTVYLGAVAIPPCVSSNENVCNNENVYHEIQTHESILRAKAPDLFLHYKKAAALLTAEIGRKTQFTDVNVFGGKLDPGIFTAMPSVFNASLATPSNTGVYPISEFDEPSYQSYSYDDLGLMVGNLYKQYSFDEPKDLLRDPVSMAPNRVLQSFLDLTFYRKLLKYVTLVSSDGATELTIPGQYYQILNPPLPILADEPLADDSFTFNPGPVTDLAGLNMATLTNEMIFKYGWPWHPSPMLSRSGPAFVSSDDAPKFLKNPYEFNCKTGIPADNAEQLTTDPTKLGSRLCLIHEACTGTNYNCGSMGPADSANAGTDIDTIANIYRVKRSPTAYRPNSMACPLPGFSPTCFGVNYNSDGTYELTGPSTIAAPVCIHGIPRCHPNINWPPLCADLNGTVAAQPYDQPVCQDYIQGLPFSGHPARTHTAASSDDDATIGSTGGLPIGRGTLVFPDADTIPTVENNIAHYLMDLSTIQGGTWTNNVVARANERCQAFKDHFKGLNPDCALVIVTDGVPKGLDFEGREEMSDSDILNDLQGQVKTFTGSAANELGGKIYTWYLNHQPSAYTNMYEILLSMKTLGTLERNVEEIFINYVSNMLEIPDDGSLEAWKDNRPAGMPTAEDYNNIVLPEHLLDLENRANFEGVMSPSNGNANLSYFSSGLTNSNAGITPDPSFYVAVEQLAAKLKREVKFQK